MISREIVKKTIENLPDEFTIDDLIEKLLFIEKIEAGRKQAHEGKVVSHEEAKDIISKWLE